MRRTASLALALLLAACSHRMYQRSPGGAERDAVLEAARALLSDAPAPRLDLTGRMALLDLLRQNILRKETLDAPSQELLSLAVLMVRGTEQSGRPFTEPELRGAALGALESLDLSGELLGILFGGQAAVPSESTRRQAVEAKAAALDLRSCEQRPPSVTYDAELLKHLDAPDSAFWSNWRRGLERLHLVTFHCDGARGAVLVSQHGSEAPRLLAWQFFAPEVWDPLAEKLTRLLGTPG